MRHNVCQLYKSFKSLQLSIEHVFCYSFSSLERRYGCYRLGIVVAVLIVLVLIIGTIPASLTFQNNRIVLICLCITLVVVIILLTLFFIWQQRNARRLREQYGRPYVPQIYNHVSYRSNYRVFFALGTEMTNDC